MHSEASLPFARGGGTQHAERGNVCASASYEARDSILASDSSHRTPPKCFSMQEATSHCRISVPKPLLALSRTFFSSGG